MSIDFQQLYNFLVHPIIFFSIVGIISVLGKRARIISCLASVLYIFILTQASPIDIKLPFFSKELLLISNSESFLISILIAYLLINIFYFSADFSKINALASNLIIGATLSLFLSKDLISFFIFLELLSLGVFLLILENNKNSALGYLLYSILAGTLFLVGVAGINIETASIAIKTLEFSYSLPQLSIILAIFILLGLPFFSAYLTNAISESDNKTASIILVGKSKALLLLLSILFPQQEIFGKIGIIAVIYFVILGLISNSYKKNIAYLYLASIGYYLTSFNFESYSIFLLLPLLFLSLENKYNLLDKILISIVFSCFIVGFEYQPINFLINLLATKIWFNLVFFDNAKKPISLFSYKRTAFLISSILLYLYFSNITESSLNLVQTAGFLASIVIVLAITRLPKINLKELEVYIYSIIKLSFTLLKQKYSLIFEWLEKAIGLAKDLTYRKSYNYFSFNGKIENSIRLSNTVAIVSLLLVILFIIFLV
ncbi:MAG: hypothetical protein ACK5BE_01865 [Alphaproteobacteria bacterium]